MKAIEKIGGIIFVLDEDDSEKYITTYRAEHNLNQKNEGLESSFLSLGA